MLDKTRAEIKTIKDLKTIFFYFLDKDYKNLNKTDLLGLNIVYGDGKNFKLDYTSPYFNYFVSKVINVYNDEKSKNNIILLNELTEKLIHSLTEDIPQREEDDLDIKFKNYQNKPLFEFANRDKNLVVAKTYVKNVIKDLAPFFFDSDYIKFEEIRGYCNRYFIKCKFKVSGFYFPDGRLQGQKSSRKSSILAVPDFPLEQGLRKEEIQQIPFFMKKVGKSDFYFKISGINETSEVIDGNISIDGGNVTIHWKMENNHIEGYEIFRWNNFHEKSIYSFDQIIDFNNKISNIYKKDKEIIDFYFDVLNLKKLDSGLMVANDKFILGSNEIDADNVVTEDSAHVFLSDEVINIIYTRKLGLSKYDNQFVMPISEEIEDITIKAIKINDESYILVQRYYEEADKMRGSYEEKVNKYHYQLFKVNQIENLFQVREFLSEYELNGDFSSITDVKKFVKEGS